MHIGLIGGIGPAATEFYYRGLVAAHEKSGAALDLTIVHADVRDMVQNATAGNAAAQAEIFRGFAERLKVAGATNLSNFFWITLTSHARTTSWRMYAISDTITIPGGEPDIPEPGQLGLIAIGIIGFGIARRRIQR